MGRYVKINGELVPIADIESSQNTNFVGTLTDWESLTTEQKNAYDSVDLIDDFSDEITEELDALNDRVGDVETSVESLQEEISTVITEILSATLVNAGYSKTVSVQAGDIYLVIGGDNSSTSTSEFSIVTCKGTSTKVQTLSDNAYIDVTGGSSGTFTVTVSTYSQALAIIKL